MALSTFSTRPALLLALLLAGCVSPHAGRSGEREGLSLNPPHSERRNDARPASSAPRAVDRSSVVAHEAVPDRDQYAPTGYPAPFGTDLSQGWFDPWPHSHFSRRGTPFVHLFSLEPAFLDRDFFLDYRATRGEGEDEAEIEAELEWALTRRIGLVIEMPFVRLDPDGESAESGLGDVAIAPRALLVDTDTFLLSGNLEVSFPTGDDRKGLGSAEIGLAPSASIWLDLGNWVQASAQVGTDHGLESGDAELFYNSAVAYTFLAPSLVGSAPHDHAHGGARHFPAGLTSAIVELTGRTILDGDDEGRDTAEVLFGMSHNVTGSWEVRAGYQVPIGGPQDIDDAFVFSLIYHF